MLRAYPYPSLFSLSLVAARTSAGRRSTLLRADIPRQAGRQDSDARQIRCAEASTMVSRCRTTRRLVSLPPPPSLFPLPTPTQ
ncbi:hypothetical protein GGS23DRAFT_578606 [Durotheca rogersii]|uniref:uncharacterized protein n=1 Tax=Durotheca rogersii TaxID=419775 RepID=UPI00221F1C1E|nr:uncharacterized protein GGS23DRAFT_578606 [Durotheca rogersii]KAI5861051.1 hypothetical protein GGS23DRAFT_578606 [Durotheca rogersii]